MCGELNRAGGRETANRCPAVAAGAEVDGSLLFPPPEYREYWNDFLTRELEFSSARINQGPVIPVGDRDAIRRQLAGFDFDSPRALGELLSWTIAQLEHGIVHITHPRYFGLFNPAPTFQAQCADRIAAVFNPQLATSTTSPAAVEIEAHVIRSVARRVGLPANSGGNFTTGGSEANYTALICALTRAEPRFAGEGARAFAGPPVFYISNESHLAWLKIAHQAGIGRAAARLVATDGRGRMDAGQLTQMIAADRRDGRVPVMIVATAGTTNAGMIDPLRRCAAIARRDGLWCHVDAAWGGAVAASDRWRHLLDGIEDADSVTIDAHKWFATTMGCGMFLIGDAALLSSAFHVATSYMPSNVADLDPYVTTAQWSRRFLGLRLFLSLAAAGWGGYAAHVERSIELVRRLENALAARGWRIANEAALGVLCAEPPDGRAEVRTIVTRVLASGRAWVSAARFEGRAVLRACATNGETRPADVEELVDALQAAL